MKTELANKKILDPAALLVNNPKDWRNKQETCTQIFLGIRKCGEGKGETPCFIGHNIKNLKEYYKK